MIRDAVHHFDEVSRDPIRDVTHADAILSLEWPRGPVRGTQAHPPSARVRNRIRESLAGRVARAQKRWKDLARHDKARVVRGIG